MNGRYMLPAIGEIGRCAPDLVRPFVGPMTAFLWDEGLRRGILLALRSMAETDPGLIDPIRSRLEKIDETDDSGEQEVLDLLLAVNRESVDGE